MPAAAQTQELVVWTNPQALEEAKIIFAPYAPTFATRTPQRRSGSRRARVGVVFISHPNEDHSFAKTLASLREEVSSLVLYAPHHSSDLAFQMGTLVGPHHFDSPVLTGNLRHLKQLLRQRNVLAHVAPSIEQEPTYHLAEIRERLGLSQVALARGLNITERTLQNWEAGRGTSQMSKKTADLRELLSRMDVYVVAPKEKQWLSTPLPVFRGSTPKDMIADGRIRDLIVEFDRLTEGQPV